jgi:hypothetical protein
MYYIQMKWLWNPHVYKFLKNIMEMGVYKIDK